MNDIVTILRDISNEKGIDTDLAEACRDGAREIERLRLTDEEREAVRAAVVVMAGTSDRRVAATIRALMERMG